MTQAGGALWETARAEKVDHFGTMDRVCGLDGSVFRDEHCVGGNTKGHSPRRDSNQPSFRVASCRVSRFLSVPLSPPTMSLRVASSVFLAVTAATLAAESTKPVRAKKGGPNKATPAPAATATPAPTTPPEKPATTPAKPADASAANTSPAIKRAGGGPENPELKFHPAVPPPLSPEDELKTLKVAPGFKVELVASEPMIQDPIAVSWDDQGRMYVVEMRGYMHDMDAAGEDQPIGRIQRLEDTDGDGKYDKATTFVDKLLMPRAVMAIGDGALVAEPPNLTFYHDTDGDGVADQSEVIETKYAAKGGQPEHMANSPTWMMDNWIWSNGHSFRYRYQGGKFVTEQVNGFGQWGRTQDDFGRQYFNYNSDLLRCDLVSPTYYARNQRLGTRAAINFQTIKEQTTWPAVPTPGVNRGYQPTTLREDGTLKSTTATCGATIYRGDLFPAEFRGNAFVPEPAGLLVKRLILSETNGVVSAKNAYEGMEFLTSTDERFRPVNAYTGPDGALYVVDMARGVIQHKSFITYYLAANIQERQLETPLHRGRIYRIVPESAAPKAVKLPKETKDIVPMLAHANGWVRDTAQRVLVERGDQSVVPAVEKLAASGATPAIRVQALWTLEGLGAVKPEFIKERLKDGDTKVRVAAVRLADSSLNSELAKLVSEADGELRMQLAFKLSDQPGEDVEKALFALLENSDSPMIGDAVATGLGGKELEFLTDLLKRPAEEDAQLAGTGIIPTLAGCVMKERKGARVAKLLELAVAQPAERQTVLFTAIAGKPAAKGSNPNPIRLDAEPKAFTELKAKAQGGLKNLLVKVDPLITWVGKPGAKAYVPPTPLTAEQKALFDHGKTIYTSICIACHQATGAGLPNLAPPLLNSEWALGPADVPIRVVLNGLTGPIQVAGTKWQLEMPGLGMFSDKDIAGVLTYVRREWEHGASPVSPEEVAKVRAATAGRAKAWTAEELKKPIVIEQAKAK